MFIGVSICTKDKQVILLDKALVEKVPGQNNVLDITGVSEGFVDIILGFVDIILPDTMAKSVDHILNIVK